jgi:hypothetical protein
MLDDFKSGKIKNLRRSTKPNSEDFRTPEEAAADDDLQQPATLVKETSAASSKDPSKPKAQAGGRLASLKEKLHFQWPPRRKEWITSAVIVIVGGVLVAFILTHTGNKPVASAVKPIVKPKAVKPKITTVPSTLTGLPVDPSVNQRTVTGVMVENSTDARPQSGLTQAGVVFEAIAEGGITRFLALYQDTLPDNIGPIRSARPYYVQWALGFDAGYAHVGGSPEALQDIKDWNARDLDQFYNGGSYHRISERPAPHNVYTGIPTLNQLEVSKGYVTSKYSGFVRKAKEEPSKQPNAKTVDLTLSGPIYNVHYDYNPTTNSYNRSEGGAPHTDADSGAQITPKVVVALVMPYALESDGYHSDYGTIGSGTVYVFQDGVVTQGQWTKSAATSQFTFTDANGKPIKLNPGQTWLSAVSDTSKVTYAP